MTFANYKPRKIGFHQIVDINSWQIKVYTITFREEFQSVSALESAITKLPDWLKLSETLEFENYQIGFMMVHEGRDGVWVILSWWTGENMLRSVTFANSAEAPEEFHLTPKEGGMVCVWELEVVDFERRMWIEHVLKKADQPDFRGYLEQNIEGYF